MLSYTLLAKYLVTVLIYLGIIVGFILFLVAILLAGIYLIFLLMKIFKVYDRFFKVFHEMYVRKRTINL